MFEHEGRFFVRIDWTLLLIIFSILAIGLLNLYSATRFLGPRLFTKQIYFVFLGTAAFFITAAIDYRVYDRLAYPIYAIGLFLLALVLVIGRTTLGAKRWLVLGPVVVQPSELMKLALIIALGHYIHASPPSTEEGRSIKDLAMPSVLVGIPFLMILLQPDLGTGIMLLLIFFSIMFLLKLRLRSVLTLATFGLALLPLIWTFVLKDYQKARILTFLDPASDPTGSGWHIRQSIYAIGSGNFFGKGFLQGTQSQYKFLPAQWSDFPFSVWCEEWGFIGGMVLIGLYAVLVIWSIRLALRARDRFASVLCLGVGAMFFWHTFINLGMVMGLMPVVGITLPLFSYGGSSVLTFMIGAGLLMSVSSRIDTL